MTLVELCAGSAAVSLRWIYSQGKPPLSWQGGKRGFADQILRALGQEPGAGRMGDVVLVEPGPWGEAWEQWRTRAGRMRTCDRLQAWQEEDPRTLWERLRAAPVPAEVEERVAVWAVLCWWNFPGAVVRAEGREWLHNGFNAAPAYRVAYNAARIAAGLPEAKANRDMRLPELADNLLALPDLSRVTVLRCRAEEVEPIPGAICYLDPDYQGTTSCYGHTFPRPAVLQVAERWRAAGCLVAVSEAEPLPLPGWHHHTLAGPAGFGRTWTKQKREVLTLSRPAAGQQSLWGAA